MRVAAHVPIWNRREILTRFLELCPLDVYCAASNQEDFNFCLRNSRVKDATLTLNDMDLKCQYLLTHMRRFASTMDAVIFLGCDDFLHPEFYKALPGLLKEHDFIAFKNIYFHESHKNRSWLWPGYPGKHRAGEPAGAGRIIRKDLLDKFEWELWSGPGSEDYASWRTIQKHMRNPLFLDCTQAGLTFVDVKDRESATRVSQFTYLERIFNDAHIKAII